MHAIGELAEWSIVADSKSVVPLAVPGVRIPHSPHITFQNVVKARKIIDLRAFCFLNTSKIFNKNQSLGVQFFKTTMMKLKL